MIFAVVHDGDAVAEALGFIHVVGGQDDGAARSFEVIDKVPRDDGRACGSRARGGLVEEEQFGIADQARRAIARRCFCPPERPPTREGALSLQAARF